MKRLKKMVLTFNVSIGTNQPQGDCSLPRTDGAPSVIEDEQVVDAGVQHLGDFIDGLESIGHAGLEGDAPGLIRIRASLMELEHILGDIDHYRYALDRLEPVPRLHRERTSTSLGRQDKAKLADHMTSMVYSDRY